MSQANAANPYAVRDPFLSAPEGGMQIPNNGGLEIDPKSGTIRLYTPIGRLAYRTFAKPAAIKQDDGSDGRVNYSGTILLNPNACGDIYDSIVKIATSRFPPEVRVDPETGQRRQYTAQELLDIPKEQGGLHYPLRSGWDNYVKDPERFDQWQDLLFINASMGAETQSGEARSPVYFDEQSQPVEPTRFYPGCYVIMKLTFYAYPKPGMVAKSRGVGVGLDAVWFVRHGEKMNLYNAAKSAIDGFVGAGIIIPQEVPRGAPSGSGGQIGYGHHPRTPAAIPPTRVHGFAEAPQQRQQAYVPPQQVVENEPQQDTGGEEDMGYVPEAQQQPVQPPPQPPPQQVRPQPGARPAAAPAGYIPPTGPAPYVPRRPNPPGRPAA